MKISCQNLRCPSSTDCKRILIIPEQLSFVYIEVKHENSEDKCIYSTQIINENVNVRENTGTIPG